MELCQVLVEKGPRRVVHRLGEGRQLAIVDRPDHALLRVVNLALDSA